VDDETRMALGGLKTDVEAELTTQQREMRAGFAETRAGFAELRVGQAEQRTAMDAVNRKLDLVIDAIADFRAEYQTHTHG
jgi:hypothetical protein